MQYCCVEPLLLGTVKDFIGYALSLNYCCFTCFVFTEIDKAKSASQSVLKFMRLVKL